MTQEEKHRIFVSIVLFVFSTGLLVLVGQHNPVFQRIFQDVFATFLPAFIVLGALLGIAVMALIVYGLAALWQGSKAGRAFIEIVIIFFVIQGIFHLLSL